MSKKPIIFNTEMVKAILDGRKTQFRIQIDFCNVDDLYINENGKNVISINDKIINTTTEEYVQSFINKNSKYKIGDIICIQEELNIDCDLDVYYVSDDSYVDAFIDDGTKTYPNLNDEKYGSGYEEIYQKEYVGIIPAEDMPIECIRIFLKVTNVRVERLQDIDNDGIFAEGFKPYSKNILLESLKNKTLSKLNDDVKDWWINLWNSTSKDGYKWEDNPYVFVYEFKKIDRP